jgi:hypothetical protein
MDRWTDGQMDRWTDRQRYRWIGGHGKMNRWTDEQMKRWTDNGQMDRWTDGKTILTSWVMSVFTQVPIRKAVNIPNIIRKWCRDRILRGGGRRGATNIYTFYSKLKSIVRKSSFGIVY